MKKYLLVTDGTAVQVERATGMRAIETPLGALIKEPPPPINVDRLAEAWQERLKPKRDPHCRCGVVVSFNCPVHSFIT